MSRRGGVVAAAAAAAATALGGSAIAAARGHLWGFVQPRGLAAVPRFQERKLSGHRPNRVGSSWVERSRLASGAAGEGNAVVDMLDTRTVDLHRKYHDKTIEYTMENYEWVERKGYSTDHALSEDESVMVRRAARARFKRWPRLDERDTHKVPLGPSPQRFCGGGAAVPGDPCDNVFVISLPRRPSKLRHVLNELHEQGVSATVVDAIDGDAILCKDDIENHGVAVIPGYSGHRNHCIQLTTGEVGCFMSHYAIWHHMVEEGIESALILEDDFDFQEDFAQRLGEYIREAAGEDWNILYVGRSPVEPDLRRLSDHVVEPGYTLWTVGYIFRLDAARALLAAEAHKRFAPLDEYFSIAMGRYTTAYNEFAPLWRQYIPHVLTGRALTPPLVMPYVGSMFESDTAMLRGGTRYVKDLPQSMSAEEEEEQLRIVPGPKA